MVLEEVRQKLTVEADYRFSLEVAWMLAAYGQQANSKQFESLKRFIDAGQMSVAPHYVLLDDRLAGEKAQIHIVNYSPGEAYLVFDRAVKPCLLNEEPLAVEPSPLFLLGPYEFGAVRVES